VGQQWPGFAPQSLCAAVGMGAFLAACTHAPLTSILMLFEMTSSYALMMPLMLACVLAYWVSVVLRPDSIYSATTGKPLPAPAVTIARQIMREDAAAVMETASRAEVEQSFLRLRRPHVYVTDIYGHFIGAVSVHDFMPGGATQPQDSRKWQAVIRREFPTVLDVAPVWQVMEAFSRHPGERLPVIDADRRLRGYVTKTDLMLMFRERLNAPD
jgi:CIC family chloride channel protein